MFEKSTINPETSSSNDHLSENPKKKDIILLSKLDKALMAMDYILYKNNEELFPELDNDDKDEAWEYSLDHYIKEYDIVLEELSNIEDLDINTKKKISDYNKKYLLIYKWIWKKYEDIIKYSNDWNSSKTDYLIKNIIENSSPEEMLSFLVDINNDIHYNIYQSNNLKKSYEIFTKNLNTKIFEVFKSKNVDDTYFIKLAKLLTWRLESNHIDTYLEDQDLANNILLYVLNNWWNSLKIDKLNTSYRFEDKEILNKQPLEIILDFKERVSKKCEKCLNNILTNNIFKDILYKVSNNEDISYKDLDYTEKVRLSLLYNLWKDLEEKLDYNTSEEHNSKIFSESYQSIAKTIRDNAIGQIEDNFSSDNAFKNDFWYWKDAKEIWLEWEKAEAYELLRDINWFWLIDFSDSNLNFWTDLWKIASVLAVSIALPLVLIPTSWIILTWVAIGATATFASMIFFPKWYDTKWEAFEDIWSSLAFNSIWWWVWWAIIKKFWSKYIISSSWNRTPYTPWTTLQVWERLWNAPFLDKWSIRDKVIFIWDISILWFGAETIRQDYMKDKYSIYNNQVDNKDDSNTTISSTNNPVNTK